MEFTFEASLGYFGVWIAVLFLAGCVINGVYVLADYVEEHLPLVRRVLLVLTKATAALLLLLWALERPSWTCMVPSVAAQLGYYRLLARSRFPFVGLGDPALLLPGLLSIVAHLAWMRHHMDSWHHIAVVLGFFLTAVWLVPFAVLISLAANENCLPGAASGMPNSWVHQQQRQDASAPAAPASASAAGAGKRNRATRTRFSLLVDAFMGSGQREGGSSSKKGSRDW